MMMARMRGKNTTPELVVRRYLRRSGLRYRLHVRSLPGAPDIVLPRYRSVVFVHGCFWHQHPGCKFAYTPKSNTAFWQSKLRANRERDARQEAELREQGWTVYTIWECMVESETNLTNLVSAICQAPS